MENFNYLNLNFSTFIQNLLFSSTYSPGDSVLKPDTFIIFLSDLIVQQSATRNEVLEILLVVVSHRIIRERGIFFCRLCKYNIDYIRFTEYENIICIHTHWLWFEDKNYASVRCTRLFYLLWYS